MMRVEGAEMVLRGPAGFGAVLEGEALVSRDAFSPRYDLDRDTGVISRHGHAIAGASIAGKILVITTAKGGVAAGWAFYDIVRRGVGPLAIICRETNPVLVQGAVLAGIPIMHRLEPDPVTALCTGDWLRLDPAAGSVTILRRATDHARHASKSGACKQGEEPCLTNQFGSASA